jgi:hypothetical protein
VEAEAEATVSEINKYRGPQARRTEARLVAPLPVRAEARPAQVVRAALPAWEGPVVVVAAPAVDDGDK